MKRHVLTLAFVLLVVSPALVAGEHTSASGGRGRLYIGWGAVDITPEGPVALAGQYHARVTTDVHDPVTATVVALETRTGQTSIDHAVIVSCDLVAIRKPVTERLRARLADRAPGLDPRKVIVAATHTHTAPVTTWGEDTPHPYDFSGIWAYRLPQTGILHPKEYVEFLVDRLAQAVVEAWSSRTPGALSRGQGYAVVAHNRRAVFKDGTAVMYGRTNSPDFRYIEGNSDHRVDLLYLWDTERRLTGVAINVSCPSQEVEGWRRISADFWDDVRHVLRERHGRALQVLPLCGASGDQSPHVMFGRAAERKRLEAAGLTETRAIALRIADAVESERPTAARQSVRELTLRHQVVELPLPVRAISPERLAAAREEFEAGKASFDELADRQWMTWRVSRALLERHEFVKKHPAYHTEVHALRIGDLALATNPFELYTDFGFRMETRSPAAQTMVVQLACESAGYLATPRAVRGGGYSARVDDGIVGPEGGDVLVDETVKLLEGLWKED